MFVRLEMCDRRDLCHKMYVCVCEARPVWTGVSMGGAFVQDIHAVALHLLSTPLASEW